MKKTKVLFVCLGNICRSPAAQGVMEGLVMQRGLEAEFEIDSAGLYGGHAGNLPDRRMRVHAQRRGLDLTHRSRMVKLSDFDNFDIIVAMDNSNYDRLRDMAITAEQEKKVVKMADYFTQHPWADCVPDPYYEGAEGFEKALDLIEDGCNTLLTQLKA
ncbi:MAG: low molecular weight phosphotyrosine protein phosphatase [Candidatus Amulumruptor caecigallinarius]|nr:low molecular weight phosphotyrosine protein phosphatase [Candidatus Amulumruptor caecigallinarius]